MVTFADGLEGAGPSELTIADGLKGVVVLDELPVFSHGWEAVACLRRI